MMPQKNIGYPLPDDPQPENTKCVVLRIPDDPSHIAAFWGHLLQLARWWSWERDEAHTGTLAAQSWANVWANARDVYEATGGICESIPEPEPCEPETITEIIEKYILTGGIYFDETDPNGDSDMAQIVHIGGVAYLLEDCGCGDSKFYQLSSSVVTVNSDGTTKLSTPKAADIPADNYAFKTTDTTADCFAASATAIVQERAAAFYEDIANFFIEAFDIAFLLADEVYEIASAAYGAITGTVSDTWYGAEPVDAAAAIESLETYNSLVDSWDYDGPISREQLKAFVANAVDDVDDIAVQHIMSDWANYANISALNDALMVAAANCEASSGTVPDAPAPPVSQLIEYGGNTYPIWLFKVGIAMDAETTQWTMPEPYRSEHRADMVSVYGQYHVSPTGTDTHLRISGYGQFVHKWVSAGDSGVFGQSLSPIKDAIAAEILGVTPEIGDQQGGGYSEFNIILPTGTAILFADWFLGIGNAI